MDWFLYHGDLRHEVVNEFISVKDYDVSKFQKQSLGGVPLKRSLRKKCSYSKLFWSAFSRIWTEYGEILGNNSVRMRENTDQNNSEYGHFSRSDGTTTSDNM